MLRLKLSKIDRYGEWNVGRWEAIDWILRDAPRLIDLAERCVGAEKERDRLKEENKKLATECVELGVVRDLLKLSVEGHELAAARLKSELAVLKSAPSVLTNAEEELVAYLRGVSVDTTEKRLVAIIDRLKSAAPTLNWRKNIPAGIFVIYARRSSLGAVNFYAGSTVHGGIENGGFFWGWTEGILAVPFSELAATLPASEQRKDGGV